VKLRKSFVKKFDEGGLKNYNSYGEVRIYRLRENVKYRYTTTTDECTRKKGYISLILTKMSDTRDDIITAREPTTLYTFFYFIFGNSVHKKTLSGDAHNYCASRFDYDDNDGFVLGDREITWPVIHMQYLSKVKKRQPTAASPYKAMNLTRERKPSNAKPFEASFTFSSTFQCVEGNIRRAESLLTK